MPATWTVVTSEARHGETVLEVSGTGVGTTSEYGPFAVIQDPGEKARATAKWFAENRS